MKKIILGILLLACVSILFFSSFKTSVKSDNVVVVQVYELYLNTGEPRIIVSDGKTIIRTVPLEVSKDKNIETNLLKLATLFNELKNQGYSIAVSSTSLNLTTYVFEKR